MYEPPGITLYLPTPMSVYYVYYMHVCREELSQYSRLIFLYLNIAIKMERRVLQTLKGTRPEQRGGTFFDTCAMVHIFWILLTLYFLSIN